MTSFEQRPIKVFTPSYADDTNTNAQNLTVKEIVARLPEDFHVTMLCESDPDPRLKLRRHTRFFRWWAHGNTLRLLPHCLLRPPDIYFFPRIGPLDRMFFNLRNRFRLKSTLISYVVTDVNIARATEMIARSVQEGDIVFGNSKHVSDSIWHSFGVRASTIYDGVDCRYFFPPETRAGRKISTVLYAGAFQPDKRVDFVIREAARLPHVNFRLAGKGVTEKSCHALALQLGCLNIKFLGHLSSRRLGEEMREADVFLFPSIVEGNPQVLLQASACGLPCVAMDCYHSEYVLDGRTGFQARSDEELSARLDCLLADAGLRHAFGAAAAAHATRFDWDDIARQWAEVFRDAIEERFARVRSGQLRHEAM